MKLSSLKLLRTKKKCVTEKDKSVYSQLMTGSIVKNYRCMKKIHKFASSHHQRKFSGLTQLVFHRSNKKKAIKTDLVRNILREFLERDENSIVAPGKNDVISKNGVIKTKRFLTDTLDNLHRKLLREERLKISRSVFFQCKSFWVVKKKIISPRYMSV